MKYLVWDFEGTLAHHKRGAWSGTMLHLLHRSAPDLQVTREDLRPHLQTGFPWHAFEKAHPQLGMPQRW